MLWLIFSTWALVFLGMIGGWTLHAILSAGRCAECAAGDARLVAYLRDHGVTLPLPCTRS